MFRKEHLDYLTKTAPATKGPRRGVGIDYFSYNICEDHLIGDILWKHKVPEEVKGERWHKHSLIWGDLAFQPASHMSVRAYVNRRVRWLRVRKFTVLAATLVEPNTESIVASLELAFGATTLLPRFLPQYHDILSSWTAFAMTWFCSMLVWLMTDWALYALLHSCTCVEADDDTPLFARPRKVSNTSTRRPFYQWLAAWIGREVLALPIWLWAVCFGSTVVWRDRKFKVGFDTFVREIEGGEMGSSQGGGGIRDARAFHHVSAFAENNSRCVKRRLPR
ncbi:hypothetical protein KEM55_006655 [Ascosphaera atra]|nr:hypothetical protein KEM55_006655 [Ascosphaera atra]